MSYSRIKAKHIQPGMYVRLERVYYVDDVEFTRDGEVKLVLGFDGTGAMWFEADEILFISNGN